MHIGLCKSQILSAHRFEAYERNIMQAKKYEPTDGLTIKEAAAVLGVHADTVRRWISNGKIAAEKRGKGRGQYYIPASAIHSVRTTKEVLVQNPEVDITPLTSEIYEQRQAVIKLFDRMSEIHLGQTAIVEQVRQINTKLEKITANGDGLTKKRIQPDSATSEPQTAPHEVKYREYWWQFWLPEKK